jgi:heterodisulfide reductase subunit C
MDEIAYNRLDGTFTKEVADRIGLEEITPCFTCGACTGVCPVREVVEDFDPRLIIHWIVLGMKEKVLGSDLIWFCCLCDTCYHVCPQQIRFRRVALELRNMAVEEGYVTDDFLKRVESLDPFLNDLCRRMMFHAVRDGFHGPHKMPCWRKRTGGGEVIR